MAHPHNQTLSHDSSADGDKNSSNPNSTTNTKSTDTDVGLNFSNVTTHITSSIETTPVGLPQVHSANSSEHPQKDETSQNKPNNTDTGVSTNPDNVTTHLPPPVQPTPVGLPQVHSANASHPDSEHPQSQGNASNHDLGVSTNPQNVTTHLPPTTDVTHVGLQHTPSTSRSGSGQTMGDLPSTNGHGPQSDSNGSSTNFTVKAGLAKMLKGGVIMDVVNAEQARIAEEAGACAVMALERVPADIRAQGGVARMSDPKMIKEIMETVTIPVMAKARIGHFVECQILEALGVDYIDESEVLTPADQVHHVEKHPFKVPFVCGCRNLGEALRRISEGAAMIRTKGEAGTGDVVEAVKHMRTVTAEINAAANMSDMELRVLAKQIGAPFDLLKETAQLRRLPVVNFAAGGVATPADAALMMQLGCDGVFVGSGIFKSGDAKKRAKAIVQAVTHFRDAKVLAEVSSDLGEPMVGLNVGKMGEEDRMAKRGW